MIFLQWKQTFCFLCINSFALSTTVGLFFMVPFVIPKICSYVQNNIYIYVKYGIGEDK